MTSGLDQVNRTVLVVEDDESVRDALCQLMRDEGFEPTCARNGQEALAALVGGKSPCLILLDLMMPVMNGWQLLEWFKDHPEHETAPVVVMSAATYSEVERLRRTDRHVTDVVRKPIDVDRLLRAVHAACER
jgi:CheY-like chemotaxis protein